MCNLGLYVNLKLTFIYIFTFAKVVGSIDQMEVDDSANAEKNSGSAVESKNNAKAGDSEKPKGSRKLYVGSQALGFRRDYMEVSLYLFIYLLCCLSIMLAVLPCSMLFITVCCCIRCCHL